MRRFILDLDDTLAYTTRDLKGDPKRIPLLRPVEGALAFLKVHKRRCILLTAGDEKEQQQKINVLGIRKCFRKIHFVPRPEAKRLKLEQIVKGLTWGGFGTSPFNVIVIGDRLDIELRKGKELGCITVRIKIPGGKHSYELPQYPTDEADFEALSFADLMKKYEYFT